MALLDRFIIMDDVELRGISSELYGLLLAGPDAAKQMQELGIPVRASKLLKRHTVEWNGYVLTLVHAYGPLVPRFELWFTAGTERAALTQDLLAQGVRACGGAAFELLRILEGRPRFGTDIRDRDLPQETNQTRALHFNKGCYLGQEIVERIRSRGNVHRTFTGFVLHGDVPQPGTMLEAEGKQVGELTSIASEYVGEERFALGYVRREALERQVPLQYAGGIAEPRTTVSAS